MGENIFSYEEGFRAILYPKDIAVCKSIPYAVNVSSSFIFDLSFLRNLDDIKANDAEKMKHHGQTLRRIVYDEECDDVVVNKKFSDEEEFDLDEKMYYMYVYVSNTICKQFIRRIYYLYSDQKRKDIHKYAFLQFIIKPEYTPMKLPHANSKQNSKPYMQTA